MRPIRVFDNGDACHAAEQVHFFLLVRQEIPEAIIDRHIAPVRCREQFDRLERMCVSADDEVSDRIRHFLRPGKLVVVRTEGILRAPVREDNDKVRFLLCLLDAAADRLPAGERVNHPALFGHGIVEAVGEVQHGNADTVFLDNRDRRRVCFRVVDAERGDLRVCLVEIGQRIRDAGFLFVIAVVAGEGHNIEACIGQRIGNLNRRAENRIAFNQVAVLDENRLLIDAGQIILLDGGADIVEERCEIIAALRRLGGPVDAVVDQIVAQCHERYAGFCCLLRRLLCGLLLRIRLLYHRFSLYSRFFGRCGTCLGGSLCVGHARRKRRLYDPYSAENDSGKQKQDQNQAQRKGGLFIWSSGHDAHILSVKFD